MEHSYGIIPLRRVGSKWETLLVKHQKGHWAFPKGHSDGQESPQETASRELHEETELRVIHFLSNEPLKEFYTYKLDGHLVEKTVIYFLAEVEGEVKIQIEEIEDFRWLSLEEAKQLTTFPESRRLVQEAVKFLKLNL